MSCCAPWLAILGAVALSSAAPLDDLTTLAEAAAIGPLDQLPAARAALLAAMPDAVLDDAGQPLPLDWLREAATQGDRPALVRAWERLKAARDAHRAPPDIDPERVRAETAAILAGEAYQPLRAASWIDPWLPYLERFFDWLFAPFSHRSADGAAAAGSLGVVLYTVLCLGLAALLAKRLRRPARRGTRAVQPAMPSAAAAPDSAGWWLRAEQALGEGRLTAACAAAWRGVLLHLDETGRLPYDPARTPRETVAALPGLTALAEAAARVEAALYGDGPVTPLEVQALIRLGQEGGSKP